MSGITLRSSLALMALVAATSAGAAAQAPVLVEMEHLRPHETRVTTFTLAAPQSIEIEAIGADEHFPRRGALSTVGRIFGIDIENMRGAHGWRGDAWILDAATRRVVWELSGGPTESGRDGIRTFTGRLQLPAGTYEAYFASYTSMNGETTYSSVGGTEQRRTRYDDDGFSRNLALTIRGNGTVSRPVDGVGPSFQKNAIVSLVGIPTGETRTAAFTLLRPVQVEIYALGEAQGNTAYDYGWLMNADTRERIWTMSADESEHAGGGAKNRIARGTLTLPAGNYAASYMLDDSHDPSDWNTAPPHDPAFWGLTIRVVDPADRAHVRASMYESVPRNAVVSLNRVGDDEWRSAGFRVTRAVDVLVLALGEAQGQRMDDYGWITDATTRQRVWTMTHDETEHAGGSTRNRLARATLRLEPGNYIANFRTDGSHSFGNWSSAAPMDGELWGMTVVPVNAADRSAFEPYDESAASADVIVRLVGMTDGEDARATFALEAPTNVRVYAIGEGSGGSMHDYGWIEDRTTGQVVWEMTYRLTSDAGGASKNRQFNGVVHLPAGSYVLRYRSDDSHSSERWNAEMPDDPASYGITLYRR